MDTVRENGIGGNGKKLTLRGLQNHVIGAIIGAVLSAVCVVVIFYFNTNYTLASNTGRLDNVEKRLTKVEENISNIKSDIGVVKSDVDNLKGNMSDLREGQKDMAQDVKEIYRVLLTLKNK